LAALNYLQVSNNRLTFEDLEPNMGVASTSFTYAPQDSLDTTIAAGDTLWLTVSAGGTATHYQWMLNGAAIQGATDSSIALYPLGSIDSGAYICEITNTIVTKLTLYSRPVIVTANGVVAIHDEQLLLESFALHQNYPNPFNPSTTIRFDLPVATEVHLAVYDLLGREVVRLVDGQLEAGYHQQVWNGRDRNGREVPTGIYFVLVVTPEFRKSIKIVLLK
ncbi:MAG: T9SS type A sorting domain-containing protein, partial [Candidatus Marinimicrobia bacterium]|nr:T9SS type A sorting domain-containing protein [Candidatus Neomarinimicrobiota bacterium]